MKIQTVSTVPYQDQHPGTSGLRKKTTVFEENQHYLENFIQSNINIIKIDRSRPLVIGGDGRYYNNRAIQQTIRIALANGFTDIRVGQYGFVSTPAMSHLIRHIGASMSFIFSASHNPAGKNGDVGVKVNLSNGEPAPLEITEAAFAETLKITTYLITDTDDIDLSVCADYQFGEASVRVIDSVSDYVGLMKCQFDFDLMRNYLKDNLLCFDAMHAITGPYAKAIFVDALGVPDEYILNATPLPDFGGGHPDPSPKTAKHIYDIAQADDCSFALLAASDGDGDRNMILGKGIFINPSDSLAMIAANAEYLPHYQSHPLKGVARSLPTSRALDAVASQKGIDCYATPTGWKFFCNLLDSGRISLCGEESFGTSGNHIREKDGIWAVLCWLNILAVTGKSVAQIACEHWQTYGRHYYSRYDFEGLDTSAATALLQSLDNKSIAAFNGVSVTHSGQFTYVDPTDGSVAENQGFEVVFGEKARFIIRLSGTGTSGATLRLYLEVFDKCSDLAIPTVIEPLAQFAMQFMEIARYCDIDYPSNIV